MGEVRFKLGPAVKDGRLRFVSVSQIESFDPDKYGGCERRWWFRRVARAAEPQGTAASLGEQVHKQIETYLRGGDVTVLGPIARAGLHLLPRPGADLMLERQFGVVHEEGGEVDSPITLAGVPLVGAVDCMHERGESAGVEGELVVEPGVVEVVDWKTTSRVNDQTDKFGHVMRRGLAKTGPELANTWQMRAYARLATLTWPGATAVRVSHVYFQTGWPNVAVKRSQVLGHAVARDAIFASEHLVERMRGVAGQKRVEDVAVNLSACSAWGGCPHKDRCPRDTRSVLVGLFGRAPANDQKYDGKEEREDWKMSLLEKRRKAAEAAKAAEVASTVEVEAEVAKLEAEDAAVRAVAAVAPPDVPAPRDVAEVPSPDMLPSPAPHVGDGDECGNGGTTVKTVTEEKSYACACGATLRVRPKKLADGAYYALVPVHKVGAAPTKKEASVGKLKTVALKQDAPEVVAPTPGASALTIYVDCAPRRARVNRLEDYAADLAKQLADAAGVYDVRAADQGALGFGKWKAALSQAAKDSPPVGAWAASSTDELAMVVVSALAAFPTTEVVS